MKLTQEQMEKILEGAIPSISKGINDEMVKRVQESVNWQISDIASEYAKKWITENVVPEIEKSLVESKKGLISLGVKIAEGAVEEIAKAQTAAIKKNLENSYSRNKVFEALFK